MGSIGQDLKMALRSLRKHPTTTALSIAVLTIGIGANSAMFNLVDTLLYQPQAIKDPESVIGVFGRDLESGAYAALSYPAFVDLRERARSLTDVAAHNLAMVGIGAGENVRRGFVDGVSSNYFELFGVTPHRGRWFTSAEENPQELHRVCVLGHSLWKRRGADPDVIGKEVLLNSEPYQVVGVAPERFAGFSAVFAPDLFVPLSALGSLAGNSDSNTQGLDDRNNDALIVVARLGEGVEREAAEAEAVAIGAQLREEWPAIHQNLTFELHPLSRSSVSTDPTNDSQMAVLGALLLAMSLAILLVAGLNLSTMQAAKSAARRSEIAVRLALGGGRAAIVRQLLVEGFVLAVIGGGLGLVMAWLIPRLLTASIMRISPVQFEFGGSIDYRVVAATLVFCLLATLIFGLLPALRLSRQDLSQALREGRRGDVGGRRGLFARANLPVVSEIALTLVLLVVGGLFLMGALRSANLEPGFDLDRGVVAEIDTSFLGLGEAEATSLVTRLIDNLEGVPGVERVARAATIPFGILRMGHGVQRADAPLPEDGGEPTSARTNYVSGSYFETLGLPLLRGRSFDDSESEGVVIVDKTLADLLWPEEEPLGQLLRVPGNGGDERRLAEVVGIVAPSRDTLLSADARPHVFYPTSRRFLANQQIHLRTAPGVDNTALLAAARGAIRDTHAQLPVLQLRSMRTHFDSSFDAWVLRLGAQIFGIFAAIALLLAVAGVYGVRAYSVAQRTREIGIRAALGSSERNTVWLILGEGLKMTLAGGGLGLLLALAASRGVSRFLVEVEPWDPLVFVGAVLVLMLVMTAACLIPARRAAHLDPLIALRQE